MSKSTKWTEGTHTYSLPKLIEPSEKEELTQWRPKGPVCPKSKDRTIRSMHFTNGHLCIAPLYYSPVYSPLFGDRTIRSIVDPNSSSPMPLVFLVRSHRPSYLCSIQRFAPLGLFSTVFGRFSQTVLSGPVFSFHFSKCLFWVSLSVEWYVITRLDHPVELICMEFKPCMKTSCNNLVRSSHFLQTGPSGPCISCWIWFSSNALMFPWVPLDHVPL